MDLPGVNAQERTRERLIESLQIGAQEMLATQVPFESEGLVTMIEVPVPAGVTAQMNSGAEGGWQGTEGRGRSRNGITGSMGQ